jgi:hypothetical protein
VGTAKRGSSLQGLLRSLTPLFIILIRIIIYRMKSKLSSKNTPPKGENLKLKEKSEAFSDVTHVSQRSYQFQAPSSVKVLLL